MWQMSGSTIGSWSGGSEAIEVRGSGHVYHEFDVAVGSVYTVSFEIFAEGEDGSLTLVVCPAPYNPQLMALNSPPTVEDRSPIGGGHNYIASMMSGAGCVATPPPSELKKWVSFSSTFEAGPTATATVYLPHKSAAFSSIYRFITVSPKASRLHSERYWRSCA